MAKMFPDSVPLKKQKCPTCKEDLQYPRYSQEEAVVRAVCVKEPCTYAVDLCWVGDLDARAN